ncbi:hypothetical protein KJ562_00195 [Patescibacteria group bacterium]|nr:hypothetical protein [Patescibacteria group bacterium]
MKITFNKETLYTLIIGMCVGTVAILVTLVLTGGVPWLRAAGQGTGAGDVNARFWNGADWNSSLTLTGTTTLDWSKTNVPSGMIAMFNASCPTGWTRFTALDGKFLVGGSSYNATAGGSNTITLTTNELPAHTHTGTTASSGAHTHTTRAGSYAEGYPEGISKSVVTASTLETSSSGSHTHAFTTDSTGQGASIDIRPSYATIVLCTKN